MGIAFKQGSALYISDGANKYKFLVGEATASQTFLDDRQEVKTLHDRSLVERSFSTEKSPASLNFSIHLAAGLPERELASWFDMPFISGTRHNIITSISLDAAPSQRDVFIETGSTVYRLKDAVAENLSFTIGSKDLLSANITATAPDLEDISSNLTEFNSLSTVSQTSSGFRSDSVIIPGYSNIVGVTAELTRGISWLSQKSVFSIGSMYTVSTPMIDTLAVSGSITQIKLNNNKNYNPEALIDIQYGPSFNLRLDKCSVTERWDLGTYHRVIADYTILPSAINSFLTF